MSATTGSPWWVRPPLADSKLSSKKAMRYWNRSSGRSSAWSLKLNGLQWIETHNAGEFSANVVQRSRVLHYGVSRDYRAKVGDLPEQEIQVGDVLNNGRSRLASGTDELLSVRPLRGLAAVCFCHVAFKNGTKLLSSDRMIIIKLCLQLSEELMVSFFVSCHCSGAL